MKKTLLVLVVFLLTCILISGCKPKAGTPAPGASGGDSSGYAGKTIGYSCMETTWQFFVPVIEGQNDAAEEYGMPLNMQDSKNDASIQLNHVETFIKQDIDAILVDTIDEGSLMNITAEAIGKGIPVIGRFTAIPDATCNMVLDEYGYGVANATLAAEWLNKNHPGEEVEIALFGKYDYKPSVERLQGIKETLAKEFPTGKVVAEEQSNDLQSSMAATDAVMQAFPNVRVFLGDDDDSAVGICQSIMTRVDAADYDEYYVGGADAVDEAIRLIKQGTPYKSTVDLHNYEIGVNAIKLFVDYFSGKDVPDKFLIEFEPLSYEMVMERY